MKVLLDESLPRKLKYRFGENFIVLDVNDMGWLGKKNGELLKLIIENEFDFFVTVDRNLPYQQNMERLPITIFVLCALNNRYETLLKLIPTLKEKIVEGNFQNIIEIS
jgi:hypothetical protein